MVSIPTDAKILVTGAHGFLGNHVLNELSKKGYTNVIAPTKDETDLVDLRAVKKMFDTYTPHVVIHLAARVGGIGANKQNPGMFFYENAMMGLHVLEQARIHKVQKVVALGTICCYPKITPVPFREENLWDGYPEETNAPYGLAKKMLLVQSQAYRQQYGFNSIFLMPVNLYGPGDNFDPETSHVIPALIRKCVEAKSRGDDHIVVWGTGKATREFLYVEDCAEGIVAATERYNGSDPVNIGSAYEISIHNAVRLIAELTGFTGNIIWDSSKPDGQPRRKLNTSRALQYFGWEATTDFHEGLRRTIDWYIQNVKMKSKDSKSVKNENLRESVRK